MITFELVQEYLQELAEAECKAPSTVQGYREELQLLLTRAIPLTSESLSAHLSWLPDGRPLAPTTRNRRLSILRGFVRYLLRVGVLTEDPLLGLKRAKVPKRVRAALSAHDLEQVVHVLLREPPSWRRIRDGTILLLLFYTGLRLTEIHRLNVDQVDLQGQVLRGALRKGGDVTDVALHPCLGAQLAIYLKARNGFEEPALFPRGNRGRLSRRQVQKRLKELGEEAGLAVPLHPHLLRHAHATGLLREGVATAIIQQSMNHQALSTTELYLHLDLALVREAVARLPRLPLVGG